MTELKTKLDYARLN